MIIESRRLPFIIPTGNRLMGRIARLIVSLFLVGAACVPGQVALARTSRLQLESVPGQSANLPTLPSQSPPAEARLLDVYKQSCLGRR